MMIESTWSYNFVTLELNISYFVWKQKKNFILKNDQNHPCLCFNETYLNEKLLLKHTHIVIFFLFLITTRKRNKIRLWFKRICWLWQCFLYPQLPDWIFCWNQLLMLIVSNASGGNSFFQENSASGVDTYIKIWLLHKTSGHIFFLFTVSQD